MRTVLAASAVASALALGATSAAQAAPTPAQAAPTPATVDSLTSDSLTSALASAPQVNQGVLDSLGAFVPALIGSVTTPGPDGKMNGELLASATTLAANSALPPQVKDIWTQVIEFLQPKPNAAAAPEIPIGPGKPVIQQFLYPTIGIGCIPGGNSIGAALVTAGPQNAPAPGPKAGQAGYVFTALGTGPAVNNTAAPLTAIWINIDTGKTGQLDLQRNNKINVASGPGTFTGIAQTGHGRVISAIYGTVSTTISKKLVSCQIVPTVGLAVI